MPAKLKTYCHRPGCPNVAQQGNYCDQHRPQRDYDRLRGSPSKRGYTRAWYALRDKKLAEQPYCECGRIATQVHHINSVRSTGKVLVPLNELLSLCPSCHSKKTARGE